MEYIFGTEYHHGKLVDVLKVVSDSSTNMSGNYTIERKYADNNITDTFVIVEKLREADNAENHYDWYEIRDHYRFFDKFTPRSNELDENSAGILDLADLSDENSGAITDLADYIGELEARIEALEGGAQ